MWWMGWRKLVSRYAVDGVHFDDYFYPTTDPSIDAGPVCGQRRAGPGRLAAAERHRPGQGGPRRRQGPGPYPAVWGQPPGQPRQRRPPAVQRRIRLAGGRGRGRRGGLPVPPALLGVWGIPCPAARSALPIPISWPSGWPCPGALRPSTSGWAPTGSETGTAAPTSDSTAQWSTGQALARQVAELRAQGAGGYALYRYGSLFANSAWPQLAQAECQALQAANSAGRGCLKGKSAV